MKTFLRKSLQRVALSLLVASTLSLGTAKSPSVSRIASVTIDSRVLLADGQETHGQGTHDGHDGQGGKSHG